MGEFILGVINFVFYSFIAILAIKLAILACVVIFSLFVFVYSAITTGSASSIFLAGCCLVLLMILL